MLFQFNNYSSLLLPAFIQGLLFFFLLMRRGFRQERVSDKLLAILLLIYTIRISQWMLGFAGWYDVRDWHTSVMFYTPFGHWLAVGPVIYFYFLSLTNSDFKFKKKHLLHFIPEAIWLFRFLFIFCVDIVWNHWIQGESLSEFNGTHGEMLNMGFGWFDKIWNYAESISILIYIWLTLRLFGRYRKYVLENFSDTESITFSWLRNILIAMILGHLIWIGFEITDLLSQEHLSYVEDWYSFFFIGLLIYYLSIEGYLTGTGERLHSSLHFDPKKEVEIQIEQTEINPDIEKYQSALLKFMASESPHLNPELTLQQLAAKLKMTASSLSKTINSTQGKNFNDFINAYRVDAVKMNLVDPSNAHLSLLAIALDCGFNSKATFNRAFRKNTGMSPSQFIENQPTTT